MHKHSRHPQANCIDSTASPEAVFASEVKKMGAENMKPQEQLTLEPYERDHAVVVGVYRSEVFSYSHPRSAFGSDHNWVAWYTWRLVVTKGAQTFAPNWA